MLCLRSRFRNYVLYMTRPTVPLDAQSVTSTCMFANVASYVTGQQNTVETVHRLSSL